MDWTKAKSLLIVALIVTNLLLIATYYFQSDRFQNDRKEMQDATIKLLEEKNIFVETDIPKEHPRMPKLTVQYDKLNEDVIDEQLANQEALPEAEQTDENLISMTTGFIKRCNLMTENVTFDSIERTDKIIRVTYKNYIDGIAIEDSDIICTVTDGKITDFKRYWLNPVEVSDNQKEVIPAVAALIKFMSENTEEEKIYVQKIALVYWLDSSAFDAESPVTDTAFPAWEITYNQGKVQYVSAWEQ
ncbi:MAG TPA: two-component system regulatory protein YycI [Anaerovoracaceae bacterium]|nr:two-component system regulatory protein YycI [Anaerovoracaceae bacterium]